MNARSVLHSKTLFNSIIIALLMIALTVVSVQTVSAGNANGGGYPTRTPTPRKQPRRTPTSTPTATRTCESAFTFHGTVFDRDTGEGLSYNVIVGGAFPATFAGGPYGEYSINVPAGWGCYINGIAVRADGYEPYFLPYNVEYLIAYGVAPGIGLVRENHTPTPTPPYTETPQMPETLTPIFPMTTGTPMPTTTATP